MSQILHKRARTTYQIRSEIQRSKSSNTVLAKKYSINRNTVQKWRHRDTVVDGKFGPKKVKTVLSEQEEMIIVHIRKQSELALDDLLQTLKPIIPVLSRSNLYRCLKRHGISTIEQENTGIEKKKFKKYEIGYFHIDVAEVKSDEGKGYLFVAIDRTSKFVYLDLYDNKRAVTSALFVTALINIVPYKINKILTDNGVEFKYIGRNIKKSQDLHPFNAILKLQDIEHRYTKIKHPWTNGQVERFNRTIKDNTVKKYFYPSFEKLKEHLQEYSKVHNFANKLKALQYKTPYEFLINKLQKQPELFINKLDHYYPKLYS